MSDQSKNGGNLIDRVRLVPERVMLYGVIGRFGLEPLLAEFEENELYPIREHVLSKCLKLSAGMSPRLFTLLEQVQAKLEYNEPLELFVEADANINAYAIHSHDRSPNIVVLTSSLIERANDAELKFVIGHEIGHIHYQHSRAKYIIHAIGDEDKVPTLLRRQLSIWSWLAELSADRAGFIAAERDIETVISIFFKLASGLGPENLQFDSSAFLLQLEELQALDGRTLLCGFSHPVTPIRVRSLQMFQNVFGDTENWRHLDEEVVKLAKLMDYQPAEDLEIHSRNFVLAGGLLIGHADGEGFSSEEQSQLVDMLLPVMTDPVTEIARITTIDQAKRLMAESAEWLKENAGEERMVLIRMLARVAAVDCVMHTNEETELRRAADLLDIPWRFAEKEVADTLAKLVQGRKFAGMFDPIQLQ